VPKSDVCELKIRKRAILLETSSKYSQRHNYKYL